MYGIDRSRNDSQPTDEIVDVVVEFGRWQLLSTALLTIAIFIHMINAGADAIMRPDGWWCKQPDFLKNWTKVQWISYSHSSDSCLGICSRRTWDTQLLADGYFRGCSVYNISYEQLANTQYSNRPQIHITDTIPCPYGMDYSHNTGQNLAEKFENGCNNGNITSNLWRSSSALGKILGCIILGKMSDIFGRKIIFFISCGLTPLWAIIVALSKHYILFCVGNFLYGFFDGGFCICLILLMEISTTKTRSRLLAIGCCSFALGIGLTATISYLFLSYDLMLVCTNSIFFLMFIFIFLIPESPPWLFCYCKLNQLEYYIKHGAKINKKPLPDNFKIIYIEIQDDRYKLPDQKPDLWNIISEPEIAYEVIGITYFIILYGIIFGSTTYAILATATKSHLANSLLAISVVIGVLCGQICLLLMGHRKILQISIALVLISSIMLTIDLHDLKPLSTGPTITLLLINIATVSLSYSVLLNYNTRTLPTLLRGTIFGIWKALWTLFVWIGNNNYLQFPTNAFAVIFSCILAALLSLNIKDIYDRELPDTVFDSFCFQW
ncbi:hypothetical protein PV328_008258 [Microctonus aethiopoides]|uniref:Major facilitator superfamily (MFS) profile domain-containing protein n=1 Tax=Microctonus aethiopoides TaxID=144406 RepID=A0AA39CAG3_9HYME|nr:hypothetical protein PV328_008258 [Microctonus aethiopoides]